MAATRVNGPNAVTANISASRSLSTSYQKVTLAQSAKVGSDLSISSGGIMCAKAGTVRVSGQAYFAGVSDTHVCNVRVLKGSDFVVQSALRSSGDRALVQVAPRLVEVAAGDVLYMHAANTSNATGSVPASNDAERTYTYLTVEYV